MNNFLDYLRKDWLRITISFMVAFWIWNTIEAQTAVDREIKLNVTTLAQRDLSGNNNLFLRIRGPEGWKLTEPREGEAASIWLRGSAAELQNFISQQCSASANILFEAEPNQNRVDFAIRPEQLDWLRPSDAKRLLANVQRAQPLQKLTFERMVTKTLVLNPGHVSLDGTPAPTHKLATEDIQFLNHTQITLDGPKSAIESINPNTILSTLQIASNTREDITARLNLNNKWRKAGIRMNPSQIDVRIPVHLKQTESFTWLPSGEDLYLLAPPEEAGKWQVLEWQPTRWTAKMNRVSPTGLELDAKWIQEHVVLVLPMNTLSSDSLDQTTLKVEAVLVGFDDIEEMHFFRNNLTITPSQAENAIVTVVRTK
jgi:hypothetical protein